MRQVTGWCHPMLVATLLGSASWAAPWFAPDWLEGPGAPRFEVLDTTGSLGGYADRTKTVGLADLVRFHGHACDGLVLAAAAFDAATPAVFPDGVWDRTDAAATTNASPCFGDVAAYLTGGRIAYGTRKIDPGLGHEWILWRPSTRAAVRVRLRPGIFPAGLARVERWIRGGLSSPVLSAWVQALQSGFARQLLARPRSEAFTVEKLDGFAWEPDAYPHRSRRADLLRKGPYPAALGRAPGRVP